MPYLVVETRVPHSEIEVFVRVMVLDNTVKTVTEQTKVLEPVHAILFRTIHLYVHSKRLRVRVRVEKANLVSKGIHHEVLYFVGATVTLFTVGVRFMDYLILRLAKKVAVVGYILDVIRVELSPAGDTEKASRLGVKTETEVVG